MVTSHASIALPKPGVQSSVSSKGLRFACSKVMRPPASSLTLQSQRQLKVRAGSSEGGELPGTASKSSTSTAVQNPPVKARPLVPSEDLSLQTVFVEDTNVSVEGVAKVDRRAPSADASAWSRVALLVGGDIILLVAFAAIGRLSHGMSVVDWEVVRTADPFIAGWLLGAYLLGGYGPDGQGANGFSTAVVSALKSWAVGIPIALVIRGVSSGHVPAQPFIVVSLGSTLVLMVGWRAAVTALFPTGKSSNDKPAGSKKGSVFELFQLLSSLVRRW